MTDSLKQLAQAMLAETQRYAEELAAQVAPTPADTAMVTAEGDSDGTSRPAEPHAEPHTEPDAEPLATSDDSASNTTQLMDQREIEAAIEAVLFVSDKPISADRLREIVQPASVPLFQEAMSALMDRYQQTRSGIECVAVAGGYQLRTKVGLASCLKRLTRIQTQRLSSGAMESLAIIAYKQPVLKEDIDRVRGVDSSHFLRTLMDRGLVQIAGRSELPGRPILYSTTPAFLELFGLKDLQALPPLREIEQMVAASEVGALNSRDEQDPRILAMRKMVEEMRFDRSGSLNYDPAEDDQLLSQIRERVQAISSTTPTIEALRAPKPPSPAVSEAPPADSPPPGLGI